MLDAVSDSRRGSLVPPGSRRGSRQGSISLAGTERRGSYYGDDVSKRATVAVVVDGEGKGRALNGEGKKRSFFTQQFFNRSKNNTLQNDIKYCFSNVYQFERYPTKCFRWCS